MSKIKKSALKKILVFLLVVVNLSLNFMLGTSEKSAFLMKEYQKYYEHEENVKNQQLITKECNEEVAVCA